MTDDSALLLRLQRVYYRIDDRLFDLGIQALPFKGEEPDPDPVARHAELTAAQVLIRAVINGRDPILEEMCATCWREEGSCENPDVPCGEEPEDCFREISEPAEWGDNPLDVTA